MGKYGGRNTQWLAGVEAGDTGIWMGTRLQSFNLWEGHPNCIEPGKRPRITLTPTLVLQGNKPSLAVSIVGGDGQDQAGLQLVLNHIDFQLDPVASAGRDPIQYESSSRIVSTDATRIGNAFDLTRHWRRGLG
jgi:gamma-glutamyltranspeptidase/glutathione hydrolase